MKKLKRLLRVSKRGTAKKMAYYKQKIADLKQKMSLWKQKRMDSIRATKQLVASKYSSSSALKKVGLGVAGILVVLGLAFLFLSSERKLTINNPTVTTPDSSCPWVMQPMTPDDPNNRWFADGIIEITNAKTPEDAKAAARVWIEKVSKYHNLLVAAGRVILPENMSNFDESTISPDGSCANDATVQLAKAIELNAIGLSKSVVAVNAPVNGYNTGVEKGVVVGSAYPGISGDRRAVQITLQDGRKVWIMGRCGNIVTTKDVIKRHGKTDEKRRQQPKQKLTPKSSDPKDYKKPGDDNTKDSGKGIKPKVSENRPADANPPIVSSSKTGGGGVVDTPTNKPGSETGVKAPGASPAPPTPAAPKPNEGGSNNGVVTD